jgi:hypothetical protein
MTQAEILMDAFDRNEKLTVLSALTKYGIYALSQRCGELNKMGYPVASETIKLPSGKKVSMYYRGVIACG